MSLNVGWGLNPQFDSIHEPNKCQEVMV
jgi:hypothetical protein